MPLDDNGSGERNQRGLSEQTEIQSEVSGIYEAHAKSLFRYLLCLTRNFDLAQEAVQETFLRYYEYRLQSHAIPVGRGWFFKVARNYVIDQIRADKPERHVRIEEAVSNPDDRYCPHQTFMRMEILEQMSAFLTGRELECLQLRTEGFKYKEIAGILGIEAGTVGATLAHGLKKIRAFHVDRSEEVSGAKPVEQG